MFKKILIYIFTFIALFMSLDLVSAAWVVDLGPVDDKIAEISIKTWPNWNIKDVINNTWFSLLSTIKVIIIWIFVIYMVYQWVKMIMSMWTDEDKIKSAKRWIWYAIIWVIIINMPETIYKAFYWPKEVNNVFVSSIDFNYLINWIVWLLELWILFAAIFVFIYAWVKLIVWWKDPKVVSETKMKILYSIVALIFLWFIEAWKNFAFNWKIADWVSIFKSLINLMLFLAAPIAMFFLSLAWYYYITSWGNEENVKKAKSIITYVLLWTLIFLASYTFLLELNTFTP